jgi:phenylpyruvate tautomerase PptA (4-oxalocrotonate tautomerase family)
MDAHGARSVKRGNTERRATMPVLLIEAPPGIRPGAKKRLVERATAALDEAYHIPDVRIFIREYPPENVGQDGRLQAEPVRPVCFIEAPQLRSIDARRKMIEGINAAVAEAYEGIANIREALILHNEYPLENAGWAGRLQSDNPEVVQAIMKLNG